MWPTLTDEGRRLHAQVMPLLAGLEDAASEAAGAVSSVRGRLRVNPDPWVAWLVLAPALPGFLEKHPALSIELVVRDTLGELIAEGFDVAVRLGKPGLSGLVARKLLETRILTCAAPGYLARHGAPEHLRELERHECLMFRDPVTGRPFDWEFRRGGEVVAIKARGRLVVNDLATKLALCAGQRHRPDDRTRAGAYARQRGAGAGAAGLGRGTVSAVCVLSVPASDPGEGTGVRGFCCRECGVATDVRRLATARCDIARAFLTSLGIFVKPPPGKPYGRF